MQYVDCDSRQAPVDVEGTEYIITSDLVKVEKKTVTEYGKSGRLFYSVRYS
jgi:hypothetical protein